MHSIKEMLRSATIFSVTWGFVAGIVWLCVHHPTMFIATFVALTVTIPASMWRAHV